MQHPNNVGLLLMHRFTGVVCVCHSPMDPGSVLLIGESASVCRGNQYVEDPYTKARFQMECSGKISPIGNLAIIGAGASGLMCSHQQTR